jgi:hypothetical protein
MIVFFYADYQWYSVLLSNEIGFLRWGAALTRRKDFSEKVCDAERLSVEFHKMKAKYQF